jgi:hypothetical protein
VEAVVQDDVFFSVLGENLLPEFNAVFQPIDVKFQLAGEGATCEYQQRNNDSGQIQFHFLNPREN